MCTLHDEDRVFGLLLVGDRIGDVSTFADEDLGLCRETFAGHASVLLENGRLDRVPLGRAAPGADGEGGVRGVGRRAGAGDCRDTGV